MQFSRLKATENMGQHRLTRYEFNNKMWGHWKY